MQSRGLVLCVLVLCVAVKSTSRNASTRDIDGELNANLETEDDEYSTAPDVYLIGEKCFNGAGPDAQLLTSEEFNGTAPAIRLPLTGYRTRQEYRTLSVSQRKRFHKAMNELYKDGTYRCFARVHRRGMSQGGTHAGYAFLPWHRAFIALFEDALRLKDRDVSLPYWDSSLDGNMANGSKYSVMWDNAHMGTGRGEVNEGPFAGWQTVKGNLTRNVGRGKGKLARQDSINYLLTLCSFDEFSKELEKIHNGIHKWLGGAMKGSLAAFDPLFYMHHAFIDVIWEKFRQRQRATCGVDPASDYPPAPVDSGAHAAEYYMFGMRFFKNIDGMADYWINNWYNYTDTPMCANNCSDSPDLYCDKDINMCASRSHVSFGDDGIVTDDGGYN